MNIKRVFQSVAIITVMFSPLLSAIINAAEIKSGEFIPDKKMFDKPIAPVVKSKLAGKTISCFRYPDFALSYGQAGMDSSLTVLKPNAAVDAEHLCLKQKSGSRVELGDFGVFAGKIGNLVFATCNDCGEGTFRVSDASSGNIVFKGMHVAKTASGTFVSLSGHGETSFYFRKTGDKVSMRYFKQVSISCPLMKEGDSCWDTIRAENKLPKSLKAPDCKKLYVEWAKGFKGKTSADWEPMIPGITVEVEVDDIRVGSETLLSGPAICYVPG